MDPWNASPKDAAGAADLLWSPYWVNIGAVNYAQVAVSRQCSSKPLSFFVGISGISSFFAVLSHNFGSFWFSSLGVWLLDVDIVDGLSPLLTVLSAHLVDKRPSFCCWYGLTIWVVNSSSMLTLLKADMASWRMGWKKTTIGHGHLSGLQVL